MTLNLGNIPLILIFLSLLEILFILIPAFISSKITKKTLLEEIKEMGFSKPFKSNKLITIQILSGLGIGITLYVIIGIIFSFIVNNLFIPIFGMDFVQNGVENAISVQPYNPSILELSILLIIQIIIIAPCEEAFFRGFLITKLDLKLRRRYSILFSSSFFALYHTPLFFIPFSTVIVYFPYYFLIALVLAFVFVKFKNSIIPCITAHSIFNILSLLI
ncbi:MAG: lysostaphin resistance A-like protein [Candidatus Thorarchaeota archaeon]